MILRPVRTSQPQGPARIDWSNPITRGLVFAWTPDSFDSPYSPSPVGVYSGTGTSRKVGRFGRAIQGGSGGNGLSFSIGMTAPSVASGVSFLLVGGYDSVYFGVAATSPAGWLRNVAGDAGFCIVNCTGGTNRVVNITPSASQWTGDGVLVATTDAAKTTGKSLVNGLRYSTTATSNGSAPDANSVNILQSIVGDRSTSTKWNQNGYLIAQWVRELSDLEMKSLSDNPWQIFAPDAKSLWVPDTVSAGGGATVIPIGVQATGSVGTPSATGAATTTPAGVSATASVGTPVAVGGASIPATALPTGVQATGAVGTVTAIGAAVAQPAGVTATGAVGTPVAIAGTSIPATVLPAGVQASSAVGTPTVAAAAIAQPLGVAATAYVGTPTIATGVSGVAVAYPAGVQAIGQVGTLIATGAAWTAAVGVQAVASVGTPTAYAGEIVIYVAGAQTRPSRLQSSSRPSRLQTGTRASR